MLGKYIVFLLGFLGYSQYAYCQEFTKPQVINDVDVMFWNVENFFDYTDGGASSSDKEFSSKGARRWTSKRFHSKCNAVAKAILSIGSINGKLPDVVGFAEVENRRVLNSLIYGTALRKTDYKIVHFDSDDRRGIDVALLYRDSKFELRDAKPLKIYEENGKVIPTRDILFARLVKRQDRSEEFAFVVNHHPSKYSGKKSTSLRIAAIERLRGITDSLSGLGIKNIIEMGDFNDTPENPVFGLLTDIGMSSLAAPLAASGLGTIRYNGKWEMIDMFFVPDSLVRHAEMEIVLLPFLMVYDKVWAGMKPLRTYSGPRYLGGVSDHLPIVLHITNIE